MLLHTALHACRLTNKAQVLEDLGLTHFKRALHVLMALALTSSTSKGLLAVALLTSAPFQPSSDQAPPPPPPKPSGAELAPKSLQKG